VGARDINLIVELTKHVCTYELMAGEENVTLTLGVIVDSAATYHITSGVRVGRLKGNNAMRVHGGKKRA
jgi:hypothetical protein